MSDWLIQEYESEWANWGVKCECGAESVKQGEYGHSSWCPKFLKPPPVQVECNCGVGGWHSPLCKNRQWPKKELDETEQIKLRLKNAVEQLNNSTKEKT